MKKMVRLDKRAIKEIKKIPEDAQIKARAMIKVLARDGNLIEPYGKKLDNELFEIRIKYKGQWRLIYAYLIDDYIIVLSAFQKKTQKTPLIEIKKAKNRLKGYQL
jgi:phage-related protein